MEIESCNWGQTAIMYYSGNICDLKLENTQKPDLKWEVLWLFRKRFIKKSEFQREIYFGAEISFHSWGE